jgi:hypothetical protein|tara:strand:+ start:3392 stop:3631 length:240 start_codon:yes stop_codon:yes gene_type:complete
MRNSSDVRSGQIEAYMYFSTKLGDILGDEASRKWADATRDLFQLMSDNPERMHLSSVGRSKASLQTAREQLERKQSQPA